MQRRLGALALCLVVSACGGSSEADELADAIGQQIWAETQSGGAPEDLPFEFTQADADCFGEVVVDSIGYETLVEIGVTVENLQDESFNIDEVPDLLTEPEAAEAVLDGMDGCIDLAESMSEAFAAEMGISKESSLCLMNGLLDQEAFRAAIVAGMIGSGSGDPFDDDPEAVGAMFALMGECLTDEELEDMMG